MACGDWLVLLSKRVMIGFDSYARHAVRRPFGHPVPNVSVSGMLETRRLGPNFQSNKTGYRSSKLIANQTKEAGKEVTERREQRL